MEEIIRRMEVFRAFSREAVADMIATFSTGRHRLMAIMSLFWLGNSSTAKLGTIVQWRRAADGCRM